MHENLDNLGGAIGPYERFRFLDSEPEEQLALSGLGSLYYSGRQEAKEGTVLPEDTAEAEAGETQPTDSIEAD